MTGGRIALAGSVVEERTIANGRVGVAFGVARQRECADRRIVVAGVVKARQFQQRYSLCRWC